jgi:hypothetical protein
MRRPSRTHWYQSYVDVSKHGRCRDDGWFQPQGRSSYCVPNMPPPPRDNTALVGYCCFEWLPEACRHHRHNAGMIGKGPFSRHSTSLWWRHGNVDSGKTTPATTCLARHWKILLPKHSTITFWLHDTDSQPLTITTFCGTQDHWASFLRISRWQNQHFAPTTTKLTR